ncbi:MAG: hypothetical protein Dbin4_01411, partial [Alphaproteobacteria bacterium]|nr:hypothetical protein [Alphaproteobacteria bacterium]
GATEQIVEERRDGKRHRVRIEVVVERVVTDGAVQPNFEVIVGAASPRQHLTHLLTEVTLDFENQTTHFVV